MIPIVVEEPYQFIPPIRGWLFPTLLKPLLKPYLRSVWGVHQVQFHGVEHVRQSIQAGHGVILAPNHSRLSDPFVMGMLAWHVPRYFYFMASWHLFKSNPFIRFLMRGMGAYSIHREGTDRLSIQETVHNLVRADRLTIVFPEGVLSRTNDQVFPLRDGLSLIARTAAKKGAAVGRQIVVHSVSIRYHFGGDIERSGAPILDKLERMQGLPAIKGPVDVRYARLAKHVLEQHEQRLLGGLQTGLLSDRLHKLSCALLTPLENEWRVQPDPGEDVSSRVKRLRLQVVPGLVSGKLSDAEKTRHRQVLEAVYLAQLFTRYREGDCDSQQPERVLEAIERIEEDLTDKATIHRPWKAHVDIGPAIAISGEKNGRGEAKLSDLLRQQIQAGLNRLSPPLRNVVK